MSNRILNKDLIKERPIIFNKEMVKAILDDRKTQTRRLVNDNHTKAIEFMGGSNEENDEFEFVGLNYGKWGDDSNEHGPEWLVSCTEYPEEGVLPIGQLLGAVGERLWVRETFQGQLVDESLLEEFREDADKFKIPKYCEYAADGGAKPEYCDLDDNLRHGWRPSIHMPRWASRITLEITDVRVERLNAISEEDALAEGMDNGTSDAAMTAGWYEKPQRAFQRLWEQLYGEESWSSNPWVWVIEFKRVEGGAA